ncbi:hypothetical protein ACJJTC_010509 [Scirpophaga incertulas]
MFSDIDMMGFPGVAPYRRTNEFAITAEGFIPLCTHEQCIRFSEERGLLPTEKTCTYHKKSMNSESISGQLGQFRCRKEKHDTMSTRPFRHRLVPSRAMHGALIIVGENILPVPIRSAHGT